MDVRTNGGDDFRGLAKKFKAAGANGAAIRKALTKTIQTHLGRIVAEQQAAVTAMKVKSVGGRGTARRQQFAGAAVSRKLARTGRKTRAIAGGMGLRNMTRRAIKSKVAYTGRKIGARIVVDTSAFPPSQKSLPKHLDNPRGWRHPVWGHRDRWVKQVGELYFTKPIEQHREQVRRDIKAAVDQVMRTLK